MLAIFCVLTHLLSLFISPPACFLFSSSPSSLLSSRLMSLLQCSFISHLLFDHLSCPPFYPSICLLPTVNFLISLPFLPHFLYLSFSSSPSDCSERVIPPFISESEVSGASQGAGAGGVGRSYGRGGADPQQQALYRQCWYGHTHTHTCQHRLIKLSWCTTSDSRICLIPVDVRLKQVLF